VKISIPFMPKSVKAQPTVRCVQHAARNMGVSEHFALNLVAHFLEKVGEETAAGRVVRIPGFGIFGTHLFIPKKKGKEPYCMPSFSAARPFREEVFQCCTPSMAQDKALRNHRKSNHLTSGAKKNTARVFTAMKAMRDRVDAQARRLGVYAGPNSKKAPPPELLP